MVSVSVKCPHCGKSLMEPKKKLDNATAILVHVTYAGKNSSLYLSAAYGSYKVETDLGIPIG